jgi:uncharacterized damage-inducible protein DinB
MGVEEYMSEQHHQMMAQYHVWATQRLLSSMQCLDDEEYYRECGLFFKSIHGTCNHLLLAERLWWARMHGSTMSIAGLDQELIPSRPALMEAMLEQAHAWCTWSDTWTSEQLADSFAYHNTQGQSMSAILGPILLHVFNHGTHHRGQISAGFTTMGYPAPELDLLYFLNPDA